VAYSRAIFTAFGVGFVGYFVFPAGDPRVVFPHLLVSAVEGGPLTQVNDWIVRHWAARYDAFPSLHILVTTVMLACDWRWNRTRLWCMLIPSLSMVASTVLLQLHFAVDLLAGAGLAMGVLVLTRFREVRIDD
jgi:membrane-associated phospholipid phosphatase